MRKSGIALVLASGLLVVLSLLTILVLNLSRFAAAGGEAAAGLVRARLAAESGMDYAASRLLRDPDPETSPAAGALTPFRDRGDDWTFHDGSGALPDTAVNPSYSHGESWNELGGKSGLYDRGLDGLSPQADLDGDGRFTAWSGRLHGSGPFDATFTLKIEAPGGKIPVNAGWLADKDLWGGWAPLEGDGTPDHRDPGIYYHGAIARLLDNLGAELDVGTRSIEAPTGVGGQGEFFRTTRLGTDLIGNRPAGGYRSLEEIGEALDLLGYTPAEIGRIAPCLDVGPYEETIESGRPPYPGVEWTEQAPYAPIEMLGASREVLASVWRYATTQPMDGTLYGEPGAWNTSYARAGPTGLTFAQAALVIFPDEAAALADWVAGLKGEDRPTCWRAFHERILAEAMDLFEKDRDNLAGFPEAQESWTRAKAELAFSVSCIDEPLPELGFYHTGTWGGPSRAAPPAGRVHAPGARRWDQAGFVVQPFASGGAWKFDSPNQLHTQGPSAAFYAHGLTIDPPARFEAACASRVRTGTGRESRHTLRGNLRSAERLIFTSQEDFENYAGGTLLARRGISVYDPSPVKRFDARKDEVPNRFGPPGTPPYVRSSYPHVASLPAWPVRSGTVGAFWYGLSQSAPILFSRVRGGVGLARREGAPQGADQYWCLSQRFDGNPANDFTAEIEPGSAYGATALAGEADQAWHTQMAGDDLPHPSAFDNCSIEAWITDDWQAVSTQRQVVFSDAVVWQEQMNGMTRIVHSDLSISLFRTAATTYQDHAKIQVNLTWDTGHGGNGSGGNGNGIPPPPGGGSGGGGMGGGPNAPSGPGGGSGTGGGPGTGGTGGGAGSGSGSGSGDPFTRKSMTCEIDDIDAISGAVQSGHYHVVLTLLYDAAADKTDFQLYVNGRPAPGGSMSAPGKVAVHPPLSFAAWMAAEVRIYWGAVLSQIQVEDRYKLGRFVRGGATYRSPVYITGVGTIVKDVHWAGISLPELAAQGVGISARLQPCDRQGNAAGPSVPLGPNGEAVDLSALTGPMEAFRYDVEFTDGMPPDQPLLASPIFESITINLRRPGATGWTAWTPQ